MQRSLEPTAPLTSDWAVAPSGEHDAQIGAVDNAVVVQVTNARGAGADAPRCKFDAQVSAVDHAVVIVGYGTSSTGMAFWTVRNSYGTTWGESGYFKVEQTEGLGVCGINQDVAYPFTNNA